MKNSKILHVFISVFVLIAVIASTTYIKSISISAKTEVQSASIHEEVINDISQLEIQQLMDKRKTIQVQKEIDSQRHIEESEKLENEKKLEAQNKLQNQKKLTEQKKQQQQQQQATKKQTSSSKSTKAALPPVVAKAALTPVATKPAPVVLIDKINGKGNAGQAIVVTTNSFGSVSSTIRTFEKVNGKWRQVSSFAGTIGRKGFAYNKVEGDGRSPIGIYSLGTAFGRYSNPGTKMNYRQSTTNDFWVDDVKSSLYNTWQTGPVSGRWTSAEKMFIPQYNYGFVINYNTSKRIPGKGSAIFFHVWSGPGQATSGCTAVSQRDVITTLKWLNPSKNPVIIQGPMSEVLKM